jgi:NitT/TauT family transport system permease protein
MPLEEHREQVPVLTFPRQTVVSLLVFAACWQALSYLSPYLGIPPFAVPSLVKIAQRMAVITPLDVVVTLARVIGALVASFVLGLAAAMAMYRSKTLDDYLHPMIRILMAVPVVSWILFAVLWFPGVEFRIGFVLFVVCGPVFLVDTLDAMRSVPRELRQMMRSFRPTTLQFFVKLMLPAIVPTIFTSWKVNISLAIRVVTIAELVGPSYWSRSCSCSKARSPASSIACCGGAHESAAADRSAGLAQGVSPGDVGATGRRHRPARPHHSAEGGHRHRRPDRLRQVDLL